MLEGLFEEVKRRTKVVEVFPNEMSASTLATEIRLRSAEALPHDGRPGGSRETEPTTFETLTRWAGGSAYENVAASFGATLETVTNDLFK